MFLSSRLHVFSHSFKSFFSNQELLSVDSSVSLKSKGVPVVGVGKEGKKILYIAIILPLNSSSVVLRFPKPFVFLAVPCFSKRCFKIKCLVADGVLTYFSPTQWLSMLTSSVPG